MTRDQEREHIARASASLGDTEQNTAARGAPGVAPAVRVLRIIEYVGTPEFVARSLAQSIQGTMRAPDGEIRTAILGDAADFLRGSPIDPRSIAPDPRAASAPWRR